MQSPKANRPTKRSTTSRLRAKSITKTLTKKQTKKRKPRTPLRPKPRAKAEVRTVAAAEATVSAVVTMASRETSCPVATADPEATVAGPALALTKTRMASPLRRATRSPEANAGAVVAPEAAATGVTDPEARDAVATGVEGVIPGAPRAARMPQTRPILALISRRKLRQTLHLPHSEGEVR